MEDSVGTCIMKDNRGCCIYIYMACIAVIGILTKFSMTLEEASHRSARKPQDATKAQITWLDLDK